MTIRSYHAHGGLRHPHNVYDNYSQLTKSERNEFDAKLAKSTEALIKKSASRKHGHVEEVGGDND